MLTFCLLEPQRSLKVCLSVIQMLCDMFLTFSLINTKTDKIRTILREHNFEELNFRPISNFVEITNSHFSAFFHFSLSYMG